MAKSIKARLQSLEQTTGRQKVPSAALSPSSEGNLHELGFQFENDGYGGFWHRRLAYDLLNFYGKVRYGDLLQRDLSLLARACRHPEGERTFLSAEGLRFYDTETTGLGTGAGTFPFLHAIGQIEEDEWVIHQYFLDDFSEEPALLEAVMRRHFAEGSICVHFNGKSFDWPLLQNRLTLHGILPTYDVPQWDLLHPSRRLWRRKFQRVNLGTLEEQVMGVVRREDLPGKEAPARYFSYIRDGDVGGIAPVLNHNAADISALLGLTVVLADVLTETENLLSPRARPEKATARKDENSDSPPHAVMEPQPLYQAASAGEYVALAKWYDEWQAYDLADSCWKAAMNAGDATWREFWLSSLRLKRLGQWEEACELWVDMAMRYSWTVAPLVELAKYYEHRHADYGKALHWTEMALERWREAQLALGSAKGVQSGNDTVRGELNHRKERIQRKMKK